MNPIQNKISGIFIPVSNIEKARDWYCDILGVDNSGEIIAGHLYVIPLVGANLVLDSKIFKENHTFKVPAFHIDTEDIEAAYQYMQDKKVELITAIEHGHWFNFKDPDGNQLMICQC
ncbi:VOC family protein [Saliterribacillus persicus]|uniref:Catechol 2,3-dioxygenase-like lactoylglutathione lyase family enzyme n=1 Tax=Saliterribacillus persicus TaxID=930114 RepID=A0A368X9L8_9BACI|nr:VOC family protein [Saliterribacillus persicus]RCW62734.1 catechol 2,3-dioxygenase-like lactoylglutathione lyase family enzyme [Saliterribacillus persicus]